LLVLASSANVLAILIAKNYIRCDNLRSLKRLFELIDLMSASLFNRKCARRDFADGGFVPPHGAVSSVWRTIWIVRFMLCSKFTGAYTASALGLSDQVPAKITDTILPECCPNALRCGGGN
jgi:hypothetical protein